MKKTFIFLLLFFATLTFARAQATWDESYGTTLYNTDDSLGYSVAIVGDTAIAGSIDGNNPDGLNTGYAIVYVKNPAPDQEWYQVQEIYPDDGHNGDLFATDMEVNDTWLFISAPHQDYDEDGNNFISNTGAVYVYKYNQTSKEWEFYQKIVADDRTEGAIFGNSIDFDGTRLLVGAPYEDYDASGANYLQSAGAAYLYTFNTTTNLWTKKTKLVPDDREEYDHFGEAVAVRGNYILIGAPEKSNNGFSEGAAYIFKYSIFGGGSWNQDSAMYSTDRFSSYGAAVDIENNYMLVGAPEYDNSSGIVEYLFYDGTSWKHKEFLDEDINMGKFGISVRIKEDYLMIGRMLNYETPVNSISIGNVFLYQADETTGDLTFVDSLMCRSYTSKYFSAGFGFSIDMDGDYMAVGAPQTTTGGHLFIITNKPVMLDLYEQDTAECYGDRSHFICLARNTDKWYWQYRPDASSEFTTVTNESDIDIFDYNGYDSKIGEELYFYPADNYYGYEVRCVLVNASDSIIFDNTGTVHFNDNNPYLNTKDTIVYLDNSGNITITPSFVVDSADQDLACELTDTILSKYTFDCSNIGDNTIDVTLNTNGAGTTTKQAVVTIVDTISPSILDHSDVTVSGDDNCEYTLADYTGEVTVSDNCPSSFTITQSPEAGTTISGYQVVTITAVDGSGNSGKTEFTVTVDDNDPPVFTTKDAVIYLDEDGFATLKPSDVIASASDNCELADTVLSQTSFDCSSSGETIDVTVSDITGNQTTHTAYVSVEDTISPSIECITNQTVTINSNQDYYVVSGDEFDPIAEDNCSNYSITNTINSNETLDGAQIPVGTTTITWNIYDAAGNTNTCSYDITVTQNDISSLQDIDFAFVYQNPTNGLCYISTDIYIEKIDVIDITGKKLNVFINNNNTGLIKIDISAYPSGIYFLKIKTTNKTTIIKLIKN